MKTLTSVRLAMACTGEYGVHQSDIQGHAPNGADPLAAIVTLVSRANVVRKIKGEFSPPSGRESRAVKADVIADLASRGFSSPQMSSRLGVIPARVRDIAREFDIDIPADRAVGKRRRIDYTAAMEQTVISLENWASALHDIDFAEVDWSEADEWVRSLTTSRTELSKFITRINKEQTHI